MIAEISQEKIAVPGDEVCGGVGSCAINCQTSGLPVENCYLFERAANGLLADQSLYATVVQEVAHNSNAVHNTGSNF